MNFEILKKILGQFDMLLCLKYYHTCCSKLWLDVSWSPGMNLADSSIADMSKSVNAWGLSISWKLKKLSWCFEMFLYSAKAIL